MNEGRRRFLTSLASTGAAASAARSAVVHADGVPLDSIVLEGRKEFLSLFRTKYPIMQAPIRFASGPELAVTVCKAGALGSMAVPSGSPEQTYERVKKVASATTAPFVVNYILSFEPRSLAATLDAGAPFVQFSWGIPSPEMVRLIRGAGANFGVQVASADGAKAALDRGADYLVCQGIEAGGHVQASLPLSDVLTTVIPVAGGKPVLGAGGLANGVDIRRVLRAGASGAALGTRFAATEESYAHPDYKRALITAEAQDTRLTMCFEGGWPNATHRILRNDTFTRWEAAGCPPVGKRPGEGDVLATRQDGSAVLGYSAFSPSKAISGQHVADCALPAGLGVGAIKDLPSAADLVPRLWAECVAAAP